MNKVLIIKRTKNIISTATHLDYPTVLQPSRWTATAFFKECLHF